MIDVKSILDELNIDYKSSGKNVGANDINIDCPFCAASLHLGINVHSGYAFCWQCEFDDALEPIIINGEKVERRPGLAKILMEISEEEYPVVKEILERHGWEAYVPEKDTQGGLNDKCKLPKGSYLLNAKDGGPISVERQKAWRYLESRGYSTETADKYNLMIAEEGAHGRRIIIPVFLDGELVCYMGRDYTGRQDRYKNAFLSDSKMRIRDTLYNYDVAKDFRHAYLLEGAIDVWRMGEDSMGVFRSALSRGQRNLIIRANFESLTIVFDPSATSRAYTTAWELSPFIPDITVIRLTGDKDVDQLGRKAVMVMEEETNAYRG